mgnify:CR=1 FL=1
MEAEADTEKFAYKQKLRSRICIQEKADNEKFAYKQDGTPRKLSEAPRDRNVKFADKQKQTPKLLKAREAGVEEANHRICTQLHVLGPSHFGAGGLGAGGLQEVHSARG